MQGERAVQRPSNASFPLSSSRYYTNKPHDALLISRKDAKRTKRKNSMCRLYYHYIFLCLSLPRARAHPREWYNYHFCEGREREREGREKRMSYCHLQGNAASLSQSLILRFRAIDLSTFVIAYYTCKGQWGSLCVVKCLPFSRDRATKISSLSRYENILYV